MPVPLDWFESYNAEDSFSLAEKADTVLIL